MRTKARGVSWATYSLLCENLRWESNGGVVFNPAAGWCKMIWLANRQDSVLKRASFYSLKFIHQLQRGTDSCLVVFMKWTEQDLWQMLLQRAWQRVGILPLFGVTGLRASLLNCQKGTSVFWRVSDVCSAAEQSAACSRPRWQSLSRSK